MAITRRTGGFKEFRDSGSSASISYEDAKKIDRAYGRRSGFDSNEEYEKYLNEKRSSTIFAFAVLLIALIVIGFLIYFLLGLFGLV